MKILAVTNMYPSAADPSYGVWVARQIESLRARGLELATCFIDGRTSALAYARAPYDIHGALRRSEAVLIHAHYGLTGFVAMASRAVPLVVSLCGDDVFGTAAPGGGVTMKSRVIRGLTRIACRGAQEVIVKSTRMKELVEPWCRSEPHLIPNGVDTTVFIPGDRGAARARLALHPTRRYLLFPSTPSQYNKRLDLASAVVATLRDRFDVELLVVYGKPQDVLLDYYAAADVLILPSDTEGSPNVIKEAMACGLPTVAFDVGDVAWLCDGTRRHRVVERDPRAMAAAVEELLTDGERGDGREVVEARIAAPAIAERIERVYRRALG